MSKFPGHQEIMHCEGGVMVGSKRLYPTKGAFIAGLIEMYRREGWTDHDLFFQDGGGCFLRLGKVQTEWFRGCVCDMGAFEWAIPPHRFHWEVTRSGRQERGAIECWRYGEW